MAKPKRIEIRQQRHVGQQEPSHKADRRNRERSGHQTDEEIKRQVEAITALETPPTTSIQSLL
jgi:hypothetical protein